MKLKTLALATSLSVASMGASAITISFDGDAKNGGPAVTGTAVGNVSTYAGPSGYGVESAGTTMEFGSLDVTAGVSTGHNLAFGGFDRSSNIDGDYRVYQDWKHAGLGVVANTNRTGDGLESNVGSGPNHDEVLFFDFGQSTILDTVWFNGGHTENTKDTDSNGQGAQFNIFVSTDNVTYTSVFGGQQKPTNLEFLSTGLTSAYQYYAIAASGYGDYSSYVEAISIDKDPRITTVSEPGTLALLGLGLAGLGFARRKQA